MITPVLKPGSDHSRGIPDIIRAAYDGNVDLVRELLRAGVDVNVVDPDDNLTILHIGCLQGDAELVKTVLDYDRQTGKVNFQVRSRYNSRLAWEYAIDGDFTALGLDVQRATLSKGSKPSPPGLA